MDEARFRHALGHFASGVTVVTTVYGGKPFGVTVSSFASLSLRPPLVLICLDHKLRTHDALIGSGIFAVNILERGQEHLSRQFATRDDDKFIGVDWQPGQLGVPVLSGVLAAIECRLHQTLPGGDHTIFVGEVASCDIFEGAPLLYFRRGYHAID